MILAILLKRCTNRGNISRGAYSMWSTISFIKCWFTQFARIGQHITVTWVMSRKLNLSFKPIQSNGNCKVTYKYAPIDRRSFDKCNSKTVQQIKDKEMTPSKFHHLKGFIKSVLHFMYGLNLHVFFLSHIAIMAVKLLKNHLLNEEFISFLSYSCKKSRTLGLKFK